MKRKSLPYNIKEIISNKQSLSILCLAHQWLKKKKKILKETLSGNQKN